MRLRAHAPAKVNLCLFLGPAREDGRHRLVTVFESVSLADELSLQVLAHGPDEVVCTGVEGPNLAAAALRALRERGWAGPPVRVEIRKRIPVAGGMGGGSADAAAVLRLATELAPGRPEEVAAIAASLGADVPGQLAPGVVLGTGAGDEVEPLPPPAPHALVVVPTGIALATAEVYREADRLGLPRASEELESLYDAVLAAFRDGARPPRELLVNDLQPAAVSLCPPVADGLAALATAGAEPAFVCGSGPTVAGIFWQPDRAAAVVAELAPRLPGARVVAPVGAELGAVSVQ